MPDMWMDVDTALAEVPVNLLPLIDDTDFKAIEAAIAYNAAGLALYWHFVTTAGAYSVTAVTPTTGGNYDWTDQGDAGIYTIEIPASGGASINNDTEGFGWFTGVATGVLPWRGPVIGFRAAGLNNLLIDDAYSTTRGLTGTAVPAAAAGAAGGIPTDSTGKTSFNDLSAAQVNTEVDNALNTAIPGSPTADSINERVATMDGLLLGTIQAGTHVAQSGDAYARLGAPILASISADIADVEGKVDDLEGRVVGTIAAGTHQPQSGDAYARLGPPAGASIAADLVVIDNFVDDLEGRLSAIRAGYLDQLEHVADHLDELVGDVNNLVTRLGTPSDLGGGATVAANLVVIEGQTDDIGANGVGLTALATQASVDTIDSNVDELLTRVADVTSVTGAVATDAGNSASAFKTDRTESTDDFWKDALLVITSGALVGQVKRVTAYNGTTKIITTGAFTGTPADGVTFCLINK